MQPVDMLSRIPKTDPEVGQVSPVKSSVKSPSVSYPPLLVLRQRTAAQSRATARRRHDSGPRLNRGLLQRDGTTAAGHRPEVVDGATLGKLFTDHQIQDTIIWYQKAKA